MSETAKRKTEILTAERFENAIGLIKSLVRDRGVDFAPVLLKMEQNYIAFRKIQEMAEKKSRPDFRVVRAA